MAIVVTIAKGHDLGYIWKTQDRTADRSIGGYYIDAAQAGEPPGRWWGPGAYALGLTPGQTVQRQPYDAVYRRPTRDPKDKDTKMPELLIDFIASLDGYAAADGWPGWWGLEGPEYLAWLAEQPEATTRS